MNRTRKKSTIKIKHAMMRYKTSNQRNKATRRIKKCKGGASSFTVKFPNKSIYQVVVDKNHVKTNDVKTNDEYDEEHATQLVIASMDIDLLRKNILKSSGKSFKDTLSTLIVNKWHIEKSENRPLLSYAILLKNANHVCTKELIEESLLKLMELISTKKLNDELEIHKNDTNHHSNVSTNNEGVQYVMRTKTTIYDNIATLLAFGFIGANKEWFEDAPSGKIIQKTQRGRFLKYCKIPPSTKPEERAAEDQRIRDVIAELS